MGRPLSKQQMFGANAKNNIKVQFHNGGRSVPGYIVKQTGSKWFVCKDADGNTAKCKLVDKAAGDLQAGEMSITFRYDDSSVQQAVKIARHKISLYVSGVLRSFPWTFNDNLSDKYWQVEEAGLDTSLNYNSDDFEGDETPPAGLFDIPLPGSGSWDTGSAETMTSVGTPYTPGSSVTSITNATLGLWRRKFSGNFGTSAGSGIDVTFCRTTKGYFGKPDTWMSFGSQNIASENFYTFEWVGYFKAPTTGTYNFWCTTDDDTYMWIGTNALGTNNTNSNYHLYQSNVTKGKNTNSVTLTAGRYYPVRIQFGEYSGAEKMQIFWGRTTDTNVVPGNDGLSGTQVWYHNGLTKGH